MRAAFSHRYQPEAQARGTAARRLRFGLVILRDDFKKLLAEVEAKAGPKAKPKD